MAALMGYLVFGFERSPTIRASLGFGPRPAHPGGPANHHAFGRGRPVPGCAVEVPSALAVLSAVEAMAVANLGRSLRMFPRIAPGRYVVKMHRIRAHSTGGVFAV